MKEEYVRVGGSKRQGNVKLSFISFGDWPPHSALRAARRAEGRLEVGGWWRPSPWHA